MANALRAQTLELKTNLLYDASTTPNAAVEWAWAPKWTTDVSFGLNPWTFTCHGQDALVRHCLVRPELRYWFCQRWDGWFLAAHLMGGEFNAGNVHLPFGIARNLRTQRPLRIMEWNVENLFDTVHDHGFDDHEFLPASQRRWTSHRYWHKLTDVSRGIAAVAEDGRIADLVGLCEVENDSVLTMLTRRSALRNMGYSYVMTSCADARGIDVALLYQPVRFRLLAHRSLRVPTVEKGLRATRDILHAWGLTPTAGGMDTLHVFVVHLPSRAGGHQGDRARALAAEVLWDSVRALRHSDGSWPHIVVMGDFNADARDRVVKRSPLRLTDDARDPGTYCFRGFWQWLDHIFVSPEARCPAPARPLRQPWLLEPNTTYSTSMPRRTFRGPTYHGGVSDHLPIVLDVEF